MLGGVILFLIIAGLFTQSGNGQNNIFTPYLPFFKLGAGKPTATPASNNGNLKTITVGKTSLDVVVASNDELRSKGLGGVTNLPENQGMLFVFSTKNINPSFWMKDMLIPIDFIWIRNNRVSEINPDARPPVNGTPDNQLQIYKPVNPIDYVLEVNAGFAARHTIMVGDNVVLNL